MDLRETPITDSDIQCFNIIKSLRELLLECPKHMRENVKPPEEGELGGSGESEDDENKVGEENEDSNDLGSEESSDSEDDNEDAEEKLKCDSPSTATSGQFVEFIVQNGSWTMMNTGNIPDEAYQRRGRELNGLRYLISVSDGEKSSNSACHGS